MRLISSMSPRSSNRVAIVPYPKVGAQLHARGRYGNPTRPLPVRALCTAEGKAPALMSELCCGYLLGLHARAGLAKGTGALGKTTGYLRVEETKKPGLFRDWAFRFEDGPAALTITWRRCSEPPAPDSGRRA